MKKITLIYSLLIFCLCTTNAQTNNTIVNDGSTWSVVNRNPITGIFMSTDYYYFDGDSIIGTHSYKKMFSCNDLLHENCSYEGLLREENQKTYFRTNSGTEFLIYDFSLEEGMSFEFIHPFLQDTFMLSVQEVDFVEITGTQKKRIQLTGCGADTWIEGIGHLDGILYPIDYCLLGNLPYLLCYYENNELIYKNPEYSECYYDNTTAIQTIAIYDCEIYPNPIDDILTISVSNNTISRIEILDITGKIVYSQGYKDRNINISSFSKGLYLLKVYDTNKQVSTFKIIKK